MRRAALFAFISIPIILNSTEPLLIGVIVCVFGMIVLKRNRWILLGLILGVCFEWNFSSFLPVSQKSYVVELNNSSMIVTTPLGKVMIYTQDSTHYNLLDEIQITTIKPFQITPTTYGFNQVTYYKANNLIGYNDEKDLVYHHPNPWMNFIGLGGLNSDPVFHKMSRALLFQNDPESSFISIISLGLIYTMILKSLTYMLSFMMGENIANGIVIVGLIGMAYVFAYPLSLIRVIVSFLLILFVKQSSDRLICFVLFFMFYNINSLRSAAILYPLMFQMFNVFRIKHIKRFSTVILLQIALFHSASIGLVLLYPILRKYMSGLIFLIWLAYFFPVLNPVINSFYFVYQWISTQLQMIFILHGSLTIGLIILLLIIMLIYYITRLKSGFIYGLSLCLIPFVSAPWFYQVTFISVGQGDAILLQAPFNQEVILIDTGKENAYGQLSSFLNAQGIYKIDTLVITHDDTDHSGNMDSLMTDYEIIRSVNQPEDINLHWFYLKSLKTQLSQPTDNQASLMYLFQIKQLKFLLMADIDESTEIDLIRQYPHLKADILKVGHHGSASSTSDLLLSHIQARLAIISVGFNSYGHPSYLTLKRLEAFHVPIYTTRTLGDITFIMSPTFNVLWTSSMKHRVLSLGV